MPPFQRARGTPVRMRQPPHTMCQVIAGGRRQPHLTEFNSQPLSQMKHSKEIPTAHASAMQGSWRGKSLDLWLGMDWPLFKRWRKRLFIKRHTELAATVSFYEGLRRRHAELLRKPVINVVFTVSSISKWKSESVLQLMLAHARFSPAIWYIPQEAAGLRDVQIEEQERCIEFFRAQGVPVHLYSHIREFPDAEKPDIIFIHEAYYNPWYDLVQTRGVGDILTCYVPYGYHNTNHSETFNSIGALGALFHYTENEYAAETARAMNPNSGRNVINSGLPIADLLTCSPAAQPPAARAWKELGPAYKKVIWAPHWSVGSNSVSWFACGTFLKYAEQMLAFANEYSERVQFAFKPHPNLYGKLCSLPDWGKDRTDAYYRRWAEMSNTQIEKGDYVSLFVQSDAIIHDSGSFIMEYLLVNKPGMFLKNEDAPPPDYNEVSLKAIECYTIGKTEADIRNFLDALVQDGKDDKAAARQDFVKQYLLPPHGNSCAQNIVNALLQPPDDGSHLP